MTTYIVSHKGKSLKASVEESRPGIYKVLLGDNEHEVDFLEAAQDHYSLIIEGKSYVADVNACEDGDTIGVGIDGERFGVEVVEEKQKKPGQAMAAGLAGRQEIKSPMAGNVWKVLVRDGEPVKAGQTLVILEAMKMENEVKSPVAGVVACLTASQGVRVSAGENLCVVEAPE